jgi:2-polyprenyl-3-methyl-5-hydroxy-6-metoxy-1,4-benzoquinol methylase
MNFDGVFAEHRITRVAQLSEIARAMYTEGPLILRTLQYWRPYVCPFDRLVGHVPEGSNVLDIGCGAGLLFALMAGLRYDFIGVGFDVSQSAIDLAKSMAKRVVAPASRAQLFFERLDIGAAWPSGSFDVVFLVDVLHHVKPECQRAFLGRVISKVKQGGTLVYKDIASHPWWKAQANRLHDLIVAREFISYVPAAQVEKWAELEGMVIIERETINRLWYKHDLRVMKRLQPASASSEM